MDEISKLTKIQKIAIKNGGKCLSEVYLNNREKLLFECSLGHQWKTCWKSINKGAWCPKCAIINATGKNNTRYDTIEKLQKVAIERGGKCLSNDYLGAHTKLKWSCSLDHEWMAKPNSIKNGTWCPKCSVGIGERVCRFIFEIIFNYKFLKIRPDWLVNPITNKNLELDGFCKELNIAFEYNGEQHYSDNTIYPRSQYDHFKIQKCQENNVKLFIIKEISNISKYKNIIDEIKVQAKYFNIEVDCNVDILINEVYKTNQSNIFLEELKLIALKNGGVCLANNYIDSSFKLYFQCGLCNHLWKSSPNAIKSGTWCPNCANKIKSIDNAIELAAIKNGRCLSIKYIDSISKMDWECKLGHQWKASYNKIQTGRWCPECFKINRGKAKKISIDVYQQVAINKGGKCLSYRINSCYDKLEWQCQNGHVWFGRADMIKNTKQWCPKCAIIKKRKK